MGCIQTGKSYFSVNNSEERELRSWEKEIGAFSFEFNIFSQKLTSNFSTIHVKLLKRIIEAESNPEMFKLFTESDYFKAENSSFSFEKVMNMLFLLSVPGIITYKDGHTNDKANFLYLFSRLNEEDDLSQPLTKNYSLKKAVASLAETACVGAPAAYFKVKNKDRRGLVDEVATYLNDIADFILDDLFIVKGAKVEVLSMTELRDKFGEDQYFFSSGYFRIKAYEYLEAKNIKSVKK